MDEHARQLIVNMRLSELFDPACNKLGINWSTFRQEFSLDLSMM